MRIRRSLVTVRRSSWEVCHDENRIAAYAKLVETVEEYIQSRLEKVEILPEPKNGIGLLRLSRLRRLSLVVLAAAQQGEEIA
jgi:hypothetical protein